jgi:hypothetical protein
MRYRDRSLTRYFCSNSGPMALAVGTPLVFAKPKTMQAFCP